jgi:hypothetical protein
MMPSSEYLKRYSKGTSVVVRHWREVATGAARAMMATQLGPALPGETAAAVTTNMMSYVAARVYSPTSATAAAAAAANGSTSAGGAAFAVPAEALALGGGQPVDQLLLALAYDAHAGAAGAAGVAGAANNGSAVNGSAVNGSGAGDDIASAPRAAGTTSLVLRGTGGGELNVSSLTAWGLLRTRTRPTLNLLLLRRAYVCEH